MFISLELWPGSMKRTASSDMQSLNNEYRWQYLTVLRESNCRMILNHDRTISAALCLVFPNSRNWLPLFFSVFPRQLLNAVLKHATTASFQIHSNSRYAVIISSHPTWSKLRNCYRVFISPRHHLSHDGIIYWCPGSRNRRISIINAKVRN